MRILLALLLLVLLLAGGWLLRDRLLGRAAGPPVATEVSPEAAAAAEEKLRRLADGEEIALSGVELSSLFRYRFDGLGDAFGEPSIAFAGDTVFVGGRIATDQLPQVDELQRIRVLLPDTTPVLVRGHVRPLDPGRVALEVTAVEVARIPVPERFYPPVLERIGRRDEPGLAASAVAVRLPPGAAGARVERGLLIITPN